MKVLLYRIYKDVFRRYQKIFPKKLKTNKGYCVICESETLFIEVQDWLRDHYICSKCKSIPRNRALINALNVFCPDWRTVVVHESSPYGPLSDYLEKNCRYYSSSHFYSDVSRGSYKDKIRSEDLTKLTFENESFDLFITSDVFEHIMDPELAFKEIARVLKPGGMHIFTIPWYPSKSKSVQRAKYVNGEIAYLEKPVYHGNPITDKGSLVTYDWGRDFGFLIHQYSSLNTMIFLVRNRELGLDGKFLEVFISRKRE